MRHDPFYQQITDALGRSLDPDTFEHAVSELLRPEWPTIVPIRGGDDAGMDAAVADQEGEAFPVLCTTGTDVIGNLTRSLTSYLNDGGSRRKVMLATSQRLTQARRRNLERRASEKGFTLIQIYDQTAIADRLYRNPTWCRELLGLTGEPSALSVIPITQRPLLIETLIGRDADYRWLGETNGDRILLGVPGVGKTSLLQNYAKEHEGLFVVNEDRGAIVAALRVQRPKRLIVDDAHLKLGLLTILRQLRNELRAEFELIACGWPGDADRLIEALQVPTGQVYELELLTRDEIVQVVREAGIHGPNQLVREIVDQAEGKPGLAVTLVHLCLLGSVREVALGNALSRSIRTSFEPLVGKPATELLATLALAGRNGMPVDTAANLLEMPLVEARRRLAELAAGGVVTELGRDAQEPRLSVRPEGLRHALVRDLFLTGSVRLPLLRFLERVPTLDGALETLIGARSRGGTLPGTILEDLLEQTRSYQLWREYAALGSQETAYVLERHPELAAIVGDIALYNAPERTLPLLLNLAVTDQRPTNQYPEHPLRRIEEWLQRIPERSGEVMRNRMTLIRSVNRWLQGGGEPSIVAQALRHVLSPAVQSTTFDPGAGRTVTFRRGLLPQEDLVALADVWRELVPVLRMLPRGNLVEIVNGLCDLHYLGRWTHSGVPEEYDREAKRITSSILTEFAQIAGDHSGILRKLTPLALELNVTLPNQPNEVFSIFYPNRPDDYLTANEKNTEVVKALADDWENRDPEDVVCELSNIEREAVEAGLRWPRLTPSLCWELANRVTSPLSWARAAVATELPPDLVEPFLFAARDADEPAWGNFVQHILELPSYRNIGAAAVLSHPEPPQNLLDLVITILPEMPSIVEWLCSTGTIKQSIMSLLLQHESTAVAVAAAEGVWGHYREDGIPAEFQASWRNAVLRMEDTWVLQEILKQDAELASAWIRTQRGGVYIRPYRVSPWETAIQQLSFEQRADLLEESDGQISDPELIRLLVGNDVNLFKRLLNNLRLRTYHLVPLEDLGTQSSEAFIRAALDSGYSTQEVASGALHISRSWTGNESAMWQGVSESFATLLTCNDSDVAEVAQIAVGWANSYRNAALKRERHEAIYGDF